MQEAAVAGGRGDDERGVDRSLRLLVGVGPITDGLVAADGETQAHPVGARGDAIVLHLVLGVVDAVRHLRDLGPHETLRIIEQLIGGMGEGLCPVLGQELLHPDLGDMQRTDHGVIVAPGRLRGAVVGQDDPPDVLHVLAAVHDLQRRQAQTLLVDLGGIGGEGSGGHAPDLSDVGDVADEPPGLALMKDRFHHQVLGHVALTAIGIVVDEDVTGTEGIESDLVQHPLHGVLAGAEHRRAELRLPDQIAAEIEEHAGEIEPFIEDG